MTERRTHPLRRVFYKLWAIPLTLFVLQFTAWAVDREPPFSVERYTATAALPGHGAVIDMTVKRELARGCSVKVMRQFYDSKGTRFALPGGVQYSSAAMREYYERENPGKMIFGFVIPADAASGEGRLVTFSECVCNPLHVFWPIDFMMTQKVTVL